MVQPVRLRHPKMDTPGLNPRPDHLNLYLDHRARLLSYAATILGDHGDAEDVVQEAFLRFDAASREQALEHPVQFLYRIVRNLAIDGLRSALRRGRMVTTRENAAEAIAEVRPSPEDHSAGRSELRVVADAIAELPERTRIAIEMHRMGGYTLKQIAAHLNISVGLAHSLVADGIEHCRTRVRRDA